MKNARHSDNIIANAFVSARKMVEFPRHPLAGMWREDLQWCLACFESFFAWDDEIEDDGVFDY
jgi:hypothetical protein